MSAKGKRGKYTTLALIISPVIVAAFVLTGVFGGFYLAEVLGVPKAILAIALSTVGLLASLPVLFKLVAWMVRKEM